MEYYVRRGNYKESSQKFLSIFIKLYSAVYNSKPVTLN